MYSRTHVCTNARVPVLRRDTHAHVVQRVITSCRCVVPIRVHFFSSSPALSYFLSVGVFPFFLSERVDAFYVAGSLNRRRRDILDR